jgi:CRISPR-associated protein Csb1
MSNGNFQFGGLTIPRDCKRLFITAELETTNGDPRLQPTGFPDVGPVFYPDPSGKDGQICLIESEASMANLLEQVCLADSVEEQATGTLHSELTGLPYVRVVRKVKTSEVFETSSTIDGHRFASAHIMLKAKGKIDVKNEEIVEYIKRKLDSPDGKRVPSANVPIIYQLVMEMDPLALIHGFQISNDKFTFVGCRSPRALTACIVGLDSRIVGVPGVRLDPLEAEAGQAGQAIFRKERIVCRKIEAKFSIDVGLLRSLPVAGLLQDYEDKNKRKEASDLQEARAQLLVALSLWKVAKLLEQLQSGFRRRTECDLTLKTATYRTVVPSSEGDPKFPINDVVSAAKSKDDKHSELKTLIDNAKFPKDRSPLKLTIGSETETAPSTEGRANADNLA